MTKYFKSATAWDQLILQLEADLKVTEARMGDFEKGSSKYEALRARLLTIQGVQEYMRQLEGDWTVEEYHRHRSVISQQELARLRIDPSDVGIGAG
jgi:hypothetical protein